MIDLAVTIRKHLLTNQDFIDIISVFGSNSKAVFTRRPVPETAKYPLCIISPAISGAHMDYLSCKSTSIDYDVIVYGQNDTAKNYDDVEKVGYLVANLFHRVDTTKLEQNGFSIIAVTATTPFPAPTDDNDTVARAVRLTFDIKY